MTLTTAIARALGPGDLSDANHLVEVHVSSASLGAAAGTQRPEQQMFNALRADGGPPARVFVHGEAGSGKTSLILRGVSEAAASTPPVEALVLRCGEDPSRLVSETAFADFVIDTLRSQNGFASVDAAQLARAAATSEEHHAPAAAHSGSIGGGPIPVAYTFNWAEATESFTTQPSSEQRRQVLVDQIASAATEHRLVVVLDDTDKFAAHRHDGSIDTNSISNLFQHGVGFLLNLPVAIVVAVHPAYRDVPALSEVSARADFVNIDVPHLPGDVAPPPLAKILDRRLEVAGHDLEASSLFCPDALAQLQATYFAAKRRDLRRVLRLCKGSAQNAADEHATRVTILHVQAALEGLPADI
jgi:Cdc6-like AAA superfamily ATPase